MCQVQHIGQQPFPTVALPWRESPYFGGKLESPYRGENSLVLVLVLVLVPVSVPLADTSEDDADLIAS